MKSPCELAVESMLIGPYPPLTIPCPPICLLPRVGFNANTVLRARQDYVSRINCLAYQWVEDTFGGVTPMWDKITLTVVLFTFVGVRKDPIDLAVWASPAFDSLVDCEIISPEKKIMLMPSRIVNTEKERAWPVMDLVFWPGFSPYPSL